MLARDCKCVKCGKQADFFAGSSDPDVELEPFCDKCWLLTKKKIFDEIERIRRGGE